MNALALPAPFHYTVLPPRGQAMLSRFLPAFRNVPIKRKLVIIFALFFMVPFLVSSVAFFLAATRDITRREYERSRETLKLLQVSVETRLRESADHSEEIYNDPRIFDPMAGGIPSRFTEFQLFELQQALQSFRAGRKYVESAYLFLPNGQYIFADTSGGGRYAAIYAANPRWRDGIEAADGREHWLASVTIPSLHVDQKPADCVSFGRVLKNIYSSTFFEAGILVVNLTSQLFDDIGRSNELSGTGLVFITDGEDNLVWSADRAWYEKAVEKSGLLPRLEARGDDEPLRRTSLQGRTYFAASLTSAYNGWRYVALVPGSEILSQTRVLRGYFIAIFILCLLLSALGAAVIGRYVTTPIERLIVSMNRMGREPGPVVDRRGDRPADSTDEIGFLHKSFRSLSARVQNLLREAQEAHEREKQHEMRALQAQIDPHFLSNTLDSITWIARERNEPKIVRMLTALSRILQYSAGSGNSGGGTGGTGSSAGGRRVHWRDEIQWLKNYVFLLQTRYENRLEVRYDIDESIYGLTTFHLLLQPFVENAITHGFRERQGEGIITISGRLQDGRIIVEVSDNGCGMSEAKIDRIFSGESDGIGIFNVHERIRLMYGPPYGVTIQPQPQGGTQVTITFPALRDDP